MSCSSWRRWKTELVCVRRTKCLYHLNDLLRKGTCRTELTYERLRYDNHNFLREFITMINKRCFLLPRFGVWQTVEPACQRILASTFRMSGFYLHLTFSKAGFRVDIWYFNFNVFALIFVIHFFLYMKFLVKKDFFKVLIIMDVQNICRGNILN